MGHNPLVRERKYLPSSAQSTSVCAELEMRFTVAILAALSALLTAAPEPALAARRRVHARSPPHLKREIDAPSALTLRVTKNETHDIPSTLFGYMWEVRMGMGIFCPYCAVLTRSSGYQQWVWYRLCQSVQRLKSFRLQRRRWSLW